MEPQRWTIYALDKPFQDWKSISPVDQPVEFIGNKESAINEMRRIAGENLNPEIVQFALFGSAVHDQEGLLLVARCDSDKFFWVVQSKTKDGTILHFPIGEHSIPSAFDKIARFAKESPDPILTEYTLYKTNEHVDILKPVKTFIKGMGEL